MDSVTVVGWGVFISSVLIFCGSVWLVLTMILGARLAYFISATITLAFILIMGVVWSFTNEISPLGPVGELPAWNEYAIGPDVSEFEYPEGEWYVPVEDDEAQTILASELEGDAVDYLEQAIEEGEEGIEFEEATDATANSDETRLIEVDGTTYGATVLEPNQGLKDAADKDPSIKVPEPVTVVMERDEGDPLGTARSITFWTFILLVLHLAGLSWSERKVKARPAAEVA